MADGFFDGLNFHRVTAGFMAQGGDPDGTGRGGPGYSFKDEWSGRYHRAGTMSMANSGPNTGDTQFFITCVPTPHLDDKHAIFGEVIEGTGVVHAIENAPTGSKDRPVDEIKMLTVRIIKPE